MIHPQLRVPASGPRAGVALAVIGMSPAKAELAYKAPFMGPSGRIFNDTLAACKVSRDKVFVTNLCGFYIDDNDLYSVPEEILEKERSRVFAELEETKPNCLLVLGAQTLALLMEGYVGPFKSKGMKLAAAKWGITKWRGSIIALDLPSGRKQKCVVAMHPAGFIRGQWKWLPIFKYIDVPRAVTQSSFPEIRLTPREAIVGPSFHAAKDYLIEANQQPWISIDYEGRSHITCLGLGWNSSQAMSIPLSRVGSSSYWPLDQEMTLWRLWCQLLENPKVRKIAQNAPFEWIKSWIYGIYPNPLGFDTLTGSHCLYPDFGGGVDEWKASKRDPSNPGHGLAFLTSFYTDIPFYKDDGRHWTPDLGEEKFWRYNAMDVMATYEIAMKEMDELYQKRLWGYYEDIYLGTFYDTVRMEWQGIAIDIERRETERTASLARIAEWQADLKTLTGLEVIPKGKKGQKPQPGILNLSSPQQVLQWLTNVKKYKVRLHPKTKQPTVDKDTFQLLMQKHPDDPELALMLRLRQEQDFINDNLDTQIDPEGRMHSHVRQGGTNGTRWSTAESILGGGRNFQNLPRQGPARALFLPH
jgi:uracil-DNA glycosylase family 4